MVEAGEPCQAKRKAPKGIPAQRCVNELYDEMLPSSISLLVNLRSPWMPSSLVQIG